MHERAESVGGASLETGAGDDGNERMVDGMMVGGNRTFDCMGQGQF